MNENHFSVVFCILFLTIGLVPVSLDRGTITDDDDDTFQMMVAGGYLPDNVRHTRHVVSIRTVAHIDYAGHNHFCSGVIISSRHILTAAHCVTEFKAVMTARGLIVVFGIINRLQKIEADDFRRVDKITVHMNYSRYTINDIAVLRLAQRIPQNLRHVKAIVKRQKIVLNEGMRCTMLGWGQVYPHGPYANEIMYLDVIVANHSLCQKNLKVYKEMGNFCVKPEGGGLVCPGDMGSPLMCGDKLAGFVGGSQKCEGIDAMKFVNYSHFEKWLDKTLIKMTDGVRRLESTLLLFIWLPVSAKFLNICQ